MKLFGIRSKGLYHRKKPVSTILIAKAGWIGPWERE